MDTVRRLWRILTPWRGASLTDGKQSRSLQGMTTSARRWFAALTATARVPACGSATGLPQRTSPACSGCRLCRDCRSFSVRNAWQGCAPRLRPAVCVAPVKVASGSRCATASRSRVLQGRDCWRAWLPGLRTRADPADFSESPVARRCAAGAISVYSWPRGSRALSVRLTVRGEPSAVRRICCRMKFRHPRCRPGARWFACFEVPLTTRFPTFLLFFCHLPAAFAASRFRR